MYYITFLLVSWLLIGKASSAEKLSNVLKEYDQKICKNEPSCHLSNQQNLPKNRRTLDGRDCMCDFECVEYNDCCKDSEFYGADTRSGKSYTCSSSSQVYQITSCPPEYQNQAVVAKCLASPPPLDGPDNSIIRPVTNPKTRITYGNAYCALCNNDLNDVMLWNLSARCGEAPAGYFDSQNRIFETSENNNEVYAPPRYAKPYSRPSFLFGLNQGNPIRFLSPTLKPPYNINYNRRKREQINIDFNRNRKDLDNILENVRYDSNSRRFVSQYNGKNFICEFASVLPKELELYVRKCVTDMVSTCPPYSDPEIAKKCLEETSITYEKASKTAYKNKYCAKCNDVPEISLTGCPQGERQAASSLFSTSDKGSAPPCDTPELKKKFCS
ncbi:uncharacterized protein LOC135843521 [Planococcus citri]|uniref:uncharacterized protein LOC135843521 n=1 Tax=Planococcus citri TaxID=170843 RepID=UPI0031F91CAD